MSEARPSPSLFRTLILHEVRSYLRRSHARGLAAFIAVAYALGSMLLGGMLVLARYPGGYSVFFLWGNALGLQPWNYPGVLIEAPWGFVVLPAFATISMIVVSVGVGLGMAVALVLGFRLIQGRRAGAGRTTASGTIAGLTPAMITLVTLGACCSTTAAATAGVGLVAQASGSSTTNLLLNNWFLGVFQVVVVYVALIAQELLLGLYGSLFAAGDPGFARPATAARPIDRRFLATGALRVGLVAAGLTWVLWVFADWTVLGPVTAGAGLWFNWVVEHWFLGGFAVFVGLAPEVVRRWFMVAPLSRVRRGMRAALALGAWTLGAWVPPPLSGAGIEGFVNELVGVMGGPASWGGVPPVFSPGLTLALEWVFQYLLLAVFAGFVAVRPGAVFEWLLGPAEVPVVGRPSVDAAGSQAAALGVGR